MSAIVRRGKRSLPTPLNDDSDDDEVQFLEVKKQRISKNEAKDNRVPAKMCNVLTFLENSPRLKRFVKAVLSTLGIRYGAENESVEESEEEWDNVPEKEETPVPHFASENLTDKTKYSFQNTYRKIGKQKDTFVTLRHTQNTHAKLPDSLYAQHEERNFESKHISAIPVKCSLDQDKMLKQVTKSVNGTAKKHNSVACGDSTKVFSDGRGDVSGIEAPFLHDIDDIQLLFNERKSVRTSAFNGQQYLNGSVIATSIGQSNGLKNINEFCDSKIVCKTQGTRSANFQRRLCEKVPNMLRSRRYSSCRQNKMSFTTDEVVRIQEREQYQELLQRYCTEQWSHQAKPKFMKNASVQVNMDELNMTDNQIPNRYFSQCVAQNGLSSAGDRKTSLSMSELSDILQESDDPVILEGQPEPFETKSYNRPFHKQPTTPSLLNSTLTILPRFSSAIEVDDILNFKTTVNGNHSVHDRNHQFTSSRSTECDKMCEKEFSASKESPDVIFEGVKSQTKAKQLDLNIGRLSHNHHRRENQRTLTMLSDEHAPLNFPEIIFENDEQLSFPSSKQKDHTCDSNTRFRSCQFSSTRDNMPKTSSDFSMEHGYRQLKDSVPKLKSKGSVIMSTSWIQELKKTMAEEARERKKFVADQELQLIEYKKIQADKYAEFKKLLYREEIDTPDIICLEKEPCLPRLTPEMDDIIDQALASHHPNEVMSTISNYTVLWKDIDTLSGSNWLNDEIINCYMFLIQERSKQQNYPSVYAFTSFFYPKLKSHGFTAVKRWTRKVDVFGFDLLLIPLHLGVHWCLAVVDHRYKKIQYYDSMDTKENCLTILRDYLIAECSDKKKYEFDLNGWVLEKMKNIPPQLNGSDCGMFTLKYAEYITRNVEINFTQQNMQYFRRKMVYEIITGFLT